MAELGEVALNECLRVKLDLFGFVFSGGYTELLGR